MTLKTPIWCEGGCYTPTDMRGLTGALVCGAGVSTVASGAYEVTHTLGTGMNVQVAAGAAFIVGGTVGEGVYMQANDATITVGPLDNGEPGVARQDIIYLQVDDVTCSGAVLIAKGNTVTGAPNPPAGTNWIALATVIVPIGAADLDTATIIDQRVDYEACSTGFTVGYDPAVFTVSGTFDARAYPRARHYKARVWGGGGGGGGTAATGVGENGEGGGGGGGGYAEFTGDLVDLWADNGLTPITVGGGGSTTVGGAGGVGGTSEFGGLATPAVTATGGAGGVLGSGTSGDELHSSAGGGVGSGGDLNLTGVGGRAGIVLGGTRLRLCGGGSGAMGSGGGNPALGAGTGSAGSSPGGGGAGAGSDDSDPARAGGAGGAGLVIVEVW